MKYSIVFLAAILIAIVSLTHADDDYRLEYCSESMLAKSVKPGDCMDYSCNKDSSSIIGISCAESRCPPGTQIGYKEEKDKPYPYCCPEPICSDEK